MNKNLKILLIVEMQLVLIIAVFTFFKLNIIETKVFKTNTFIYGLLTDAKLKDLQNIDENDIVLGENDAPVEIIMYTKFTCMYCQDFFEQTYPLLFTQYIEKGLASLTIRYLIPPNSPQIELAQIAYQSNSINKYEQFNKLLAEYTSDGIDSIALMDISKHLELNPFDYSIILKQKYIEAKQAGISNTPVFLINGKKIIGNRKIQLFQQEIDEILESCD